MKEKLFFLLAFDFIMHLPAFPLVLLLLLAALLVQALAHIQLVVVSLALVTLVVLR